MSKKTDLNQIQKMALLFLDLPLEFAPDYPFIVYHPFISWRGMPYRLENGEVEIVDINQEENLEKVKSQIAERIKSATCVEWIFDIIRQPDQATFFKHTEEYLSEEDFSKLLISIWQKTEFPNRDSNVSVNEFRKMFEKSSKEYTMTAEERKTLEEMPEKIQVFRGFSGSEYYDALSWTTEKEVASIFAHRFGRDGKIYEGMIEKKYIYAYLEEESEVILDYTKLTNVNYSPPIEAGA